MTWEGWGVIITAVSLVLSLSGGAIGIAFAIGKFSEKFDALNKNFSDFVANFNEHMKEEKDTHKVMWERLDSHGEKLVEHHHRISAVEKNKAD